MALLSLLDDRAKPKGSRDPLGFEMVWTHFGRQIVGNLTTITSSLENFVVALLGFHLTHQVLGQQQSDEHSERLETFLRYEQLAAYLRYLADHRQIMGITRVGERIEKGLPLSLGPTKQQQILSNQASYGLWGLYSTAMSSTGLVAGDSRIPTPKASPILDLLLEKLDGVEISLLDWVSRPKAPLNRDALQETAQPFVDAISNKQVQLLIMEQLVQGGDPMGLQRELWRHTQAVLNHVSGLESFPQLLASVRDEQAITPGLAKAIDDIQHIERLLVTANMLFDFCRSQDGEPLSDVAAKLALKHYDFGYLANAVPDGNYARRKELSQLRDHLVAGELQPALTELLGLNRYVMTDRNGAPWIDLEGGRLRVKVKKETARLKTPDELLSHWDYDYFLASFLNIAKERTRLEAA